LPPGVIWAVMAAVGYGFSFWILGARVNPALPGIWPIWMIRLSGSITLLLLTLPLRQGLQPPRGIALRGLLGITALDTLAYIAFTYASTNDQLSVVSVLVSLFSAVTVLLAWLILRERLAWWQWLGVGTIFAGIALVSI
jgi:drug/metabolite transporter (DMT)-like permease